MGVCDSTDDADAEFAEFEDSSTTKAPTTKEEAEAVDLRTAVSSGDVHTMIAVIELAPFAVRDWRAPVNLAKQNKSPGTLLHEACLPSIADSREMMVKMLIDGRVRVDATDDADRTALHNAALRGDNPEIAKALIEANADPNAKDENNKTPLDVAEANECEGMAQVLKALSA